MCRSPAALATLYGLEGLIGSVSAAEPPAGEVAVDLVGRDLDEARAGAAHLLEQHLRAEELGPAEVRRAEDRAVDVGLGGEVDDRVAAVGGLGHDRSASQMSPTTSSMPVPSRFAGLPE